MTKGAGESNRSPNGLRASAATGRHEPPAPRLDVELGRLRLTTPVMPASGCFGPELGALIDLDGLGATVTKTIFAEPRAGNAAHRLTEVPYGMLNSVGIPSPGTSGFLASVLPSYLACRPPTIVSIGGLSVTDYWGIASSLAESQLGDSIAAYEVNVSCPNLEMGGVEIGADPRQIERVVRGVRERVSKPVIVKLTPNVTSIGEVAQAAESAGADAVTIANTLVGMSVERANGTASLGNGFGGLSGPAVKPVILRLVFSAAQTVSVPIIGCGGITTGQDALDYLLAGATAVQVGTATFTRPDALLRVQQELLAHLTSMGASRVTDVVGTLGDVSVHGSARGISFH